MNVSSVSSSSAVWEEYLKQLNAKRQQAEAGTTTATTAQTAKIDMGEILAELQELEDDPDALKARAAELAAQVSEAAENVSGRQSQVLQEMAADLSSVAESADLSVITSKVQARGSMPAGFGLSGLSGTGGASMKWLEALLAEDEDDETTTTTTTSTSATATESPSLTSLDEIEEAAEDEAINEAANQKIDDLLAAMKTALMDQLRAVYIQNRMETSAFSFSA